MINIICPARTNAWLCNFLKLSWSSSTCIKPIVSGWEFRITLDYVSIPINHFLISLSMHFIIVFVCLSSDFCKMMLPIISFRSSADNFLKAGKTPDSLKISKISFFDICSPLVKRYNVTFTVSPPALFMAFLILSFTEISLSCPVRVNRFILSIL